MIYVECYPDVQLVQSVTGWHKREVIHEFKGKSGVANKLRNGSGLKGMVDEDPGAIQPSYFERLSVTYDLTQHGIKVLTHNRSHNQVIILCPKLEDWVLAAAQQTGIDVTRYGLLARVNELHSTINHRISNLSRLLRALKETPRIRELRRLLLS